MYVMQFPEDMREATLSKRQALLLALPAAIKVSVAALAVALLIAFAGSIYTYGLDHILHYFWLLFFHYCSMLWLFPAMCGLLLLGSHQKAVRQKLLGIPVWYGFDSMGMYTRSIYGYSALRWELYISWQETREFILLYDGVRKILWPKSIWSEDELTLLRRSLHEKISPRRLEAS